MGTMIRRLRRRSQREALDLVDKVFDLLDTMSDDAYDLDDDEAAALCDDALRRLHDTLTDDGTPTQATLDLLPELMTGPIARAFALVRPDIRFPSLGT